MSRVDGAVRIGQGLHLRPRVVNGRLIVEHERAGRRCDGAQCPHQTPQSRAPRPHGQRHRDRSASRARRRDADVSPLPSASNRSPQSVAACVASGQRGSARRKLDVGWVGKPSVSTKIPSCARLVSRAWGSRLPCGTRASTAGCECRCAFPPRSGDSGGNRCAGCALPEPHFSPSPLAREGLDRGEILR